MKHRFNFIDLTGQRFGKLLVITEAPSRDTHAYWLCQCDCGNLTTIRNSYLKSKHTKSCGCLIGGRKDFGEASFNDLYKKYKTNGRNGRHQHLGFTLTKEEFRTLTSSDCFYCGKKPYRQYQSNGCYGYYTYNGIDRKDNNKGYTSDNSVSCCWECNKLKGSLDSDIFLGIVSNIYEHQRGKTCNI